MSSVRAYGIVCVFLVARAAQAQQAVPPASAPEPVVPIPPLPEAPPPDHPAATPPPVAPKGAAAPKPPAEGTDTPAATIAKPTGQASSTPTYVSLPGALNEGLKKRCATAICWGDGGTRWALEPLVELPIGKTFSLSNGSGALANWIDSHDFTASFAGGLRVWLWNDIVSGSIYFSAPLTDSSTNVHVKGSTPDYPASAIRRPYPSFAIGLFGDALWLGFDYQELRNGDSSGHIDPNYPEDAVVSRTWSLTVGLASVTALRTGIGTLASQQSKGGAGGAAGTGTTD